MLNICCLKWGTKYTAEYVNKLAAMVERNLRRPYRFICFTDDEKGIDSSVECFPLLDRELTGWWNKLSFFRPKIADLYGTLLYLDLDLVILSDIGPFIDYPGNFCGTQLNILYSNGIMPLHDSSVFKFDIGQHTHVYEKFVDGNYLRIMEEFTGGDQDWIYSHIQNPVFWPEEWYVSFRWQCALPCPENPVIPKGAKIITFHGTPNPHEAACSTYTIYGPDWLLKEPFPIGRPAPWIEKIWTLNKTDTHK